MSARLPVPRHGHVVRELVWEQALSGPGGLTPRTIAGTARIDFKALSACSAVDTEERRSARYGRPGSGYSARAEHSGYTATLGCEWTNARHCKPPLSRRISRVVRECVAGSRTFRWARNRRLTHEPPISRVVSGPRGRCASHSIHCGTGARGVGSTRPAASDRPMEACPRS